MIPIRRIAVIAFFAMQMCVNPRACGIREVLAGIVRIIPSPRLAQP